MDGQGLNWAGLSAEEVLRRACAVPGNAAFRTASFASNLVRVLDCTSDSFVPFAPAHTPVLLCTKAIGVNPHCTQ